MKRLFAIVAAVLITNCLSAQTVIPIQRTDSKITFDCQINGCQVEAEICFEDSSPVIVPYNFVSKMLADGKFTLDDVTTVDGKGKSFAKDSISYILANISIGGFNISKVPIVVDRDNDDAPITINNYLIEQIARTTYYSNVIVIFRNSESLEEEEMKSLSEQYFRSINDDDYAEAAKCLIAMECSHGLTAKSLGDLLYCYNATGQFFDAKQAAMYWHKSFASEASDKDIAYNFIMLGDSCKEMDEYEDAVKYFQIAASKTEDLNLQFEARAREANVYAQVGVDVIAIDKYRVLIADLFNALKVKISDVDSGEVKNELLSRSALCYGEVLLRTEGCDEQGINAIFIAAQCGDSAAMDICQELGINEGSFVKMMQVDIDALYRSMRDLEE